MILQLDRVEKKSTIWVLTMHDEVIVFSDPFFLFSLWKREKRGRRKI